MDISPTQFIKNPSAGWERNDNSILVTSLSLLQCSKVEGWKEGLLEILQCGNDKELLDEKLRIQDGNVGRAAYQRVGVVR